MRKFYISANLMMDLDGSQAWMNNQKLATQNQVVTDSSLAGRNGKFYIPFQNVGVALASANPLPGGVLQAVPFRVTAKIRVTDAAVYLLSGGTVGTTKFRFGLFETDPLSAEMLPGALDWQSMEITVTATNALYQVNGFSLDLEAGLYYFVIWCDATAGKNGLVFRGLPYYAQKVLLGFPSVTAGQSITHLEKPLTYLATGFPTIFPAGATAQANVNQVSPALFLRSTSL
jgi:hypothetical protein